MPPPPEFSALLLAGGRSSRMGRDKALLPHPASGLPLLAHQAALLRSLPGCAELLLSAPPDRAYPVGDALRVADAVPDSGPLAGLVAGFAVATQPRVLVLAVDLPFVTEALLDRLLTAATPEHGAVFRHDDGSFEPLCAAYPTSRYAGFSTALAGRELSLQRLLRAAVGEGWMQPLRLSSDELKLLVNWNHPADAGL